MIQILDARFVATATRHQDLPAPLHPELAFGGRSNVGKSSLINKLVQRHKLVRTSGTPGCTRGLSVFRIDLALPSAPRAVVDLVDLPGYGYAQRSKAERKSWGAMIEGYLEERASLRAVVVIVDARRGLEPDDEQLLEYLDHLGRASVLVATKIDKLPSSRRPGALSSIRAQAKRPVIGTSSETGEGRELLWRRLLAESGIGAVAPAAS